MLNANFRQLTGAIADQYFQNVGIHTTLLRYQGRVIKPNPIVSNRGVQALGDGTEFQGYQSEQVQQYGTSIPEDSLIASIGAEWRSAILPDARWQVSENGGKTWRDLRISGTPQISRTGRYGITLVAKGVGE